MLSSFEAEVLWGIRCTLHLVLPVICFQWKSGVGLVDSAALVGLLDGLGNGVFDRCIVPLYHRRHQLYRVWARIKKTFLGHVPCSHFIVQLPFRDMMDLRDLRLKLSPIERVEPASFGHLEPHLTSAINDL